MAIATSILFSSNNKETIQATVQKYYSNITKAANNNDWWDVIYFSKLLIKQYPKNAYSLDVSYYLGKAYFNVGEYPFADSHFSKYLSTQFSPKYYEEAIRHKFNIAKKYYDGFRKRLFNSRKMPKVMTAKEDALRIFEEVLSALPNDSIAIDSLFYKAKIHFLLRDFKESIESFHLLIRKYPMHELAIESYIQIGKVYLNQADPKHQDPTLLDLARINLDKFKNSFPKEERINETEKDYIDLQEVYAKGLYEIGQFYERTKKKDSSKLYYRKVMASYPQSPSAQLSEKRLNKLR